MAANRYWRTIGVLALLVSVVPVVSVCSGADYTSQAAAANRPGLVIVIRGLVGYWPGCNAFCQKVRQYGEQVVPYTPSAAVAYAPEIAAEIQTGKWSHLRIVGYSRGGDAAVELSHELRRYGIEVERLILIEATSPGDVPDNVRYCFNIFESRPKTDWMRIFRGVQVRAVPSATYLINYDVRLNGSGLNRLHHFNFPTDNELQALAAYQAGAPSQGQPATVVTTQVTTAVETPRVAAAIETQPVATEEAAKVVTAEELKLVVPPKPVPADDTPLLVPVDDTQTAAPVDGAQPTVESTDDE